MVTGKNKEKVIIEVPVQKFEVYHKDCKFKLEHDDASKYCKGLGDGWRLPTRKEQLEMHEHKEELGLDDGAYWSSTELNGYSSYAWGCYFSNGNFFNCLKFRTYRVRAVRTI